MHCFGRRTRTPRHASPDGCACRFSIDVTTLPSKMVTCITGDKQTFSQVARDSRTLMQATHPSDANAIKAVLCGDHPPPVEPIRHATFESNYLFGADKGCSSDNWAMGAEEFW